jgi:hypothetical protein
MLGHSSITITLDTYSHVLPNMQEKAVEAMEDIFEDTSSQDLIAWEGHTPYHSYNLLEDRESGKEYYPPSFSH